MKVFFEKFDKEQKLNLFVGDFLNKLSGYPTRVDISEAILSEIKQSAKNYIKDMNSFSDIVQAYLDAVVDTKKNLVRQIKENFEHRYNTNVEIYGDILNTGYFTKVFTINFDNIIEEHFADKIEKITPFGMKKNEEIKEIKYYKIFGDINSVGTVFISSQDIRKLKTLDFYKEFFKEIREEFKARPTVFLGVNLEDSDLLGMLDYILSPLETYEQIYMVTYTSIISSKTAELISKYNIKLITSGTKEFLQYFKELNEEKKEVVSEKKFVW